MNKDLPKVSLRSGYSDRNHIKVINTDIQYDDFDLRTRNAIINLSNRLYEIRTSNPFISVACESDFLMNFLSNVYNCIIPINVIPSVEDFFNNYYNRTILCDDVDSVLTVIEFFCNEIGGEYGFRDTGELLSDKPSPDETVYIPQKYFNALFEREFVGYRFVNKQLISITNKQEIGAIGEAIKSPYEYVNQHLNKAMVLLSDRQHPDYANSIKESITAVETLAEIITNADKKQATLGKMFGKIEDKGVRIHPVLKEEFNKLYGYTSSANGIRHAGNLDSAEATFEEAKYMLVSCSAFINYLIGVSSKFTTGEY